MKIIAIMPKNISSTICCGYIVSIKYFDAKVPKKQSHPLNGWLCFLAKTYSFPQPNIRQTPFSPHPAAAKPAATKNAG